MIAHWLYVQYAGLKVILQSAMLWKYSVSVPLADPGGSQLSF